MNSSPAIDQMRGQLDLRERIAREVLAAKGFAYGDPDAELGAMALGDIFRACPGNATRLMVWLL